MTIAKAVRKVGVESAIPAVCTFLMENLVRRQHGREGCWRFVVHLLLFLSLREELIPAAAQLTPEASSSATDLEALVQFRSSVNNTFLLSSWTGSSFCNNWHGVTCDSGSRVVKLLLNSTWGRLVGNIPLSLQNLTSLQELDLHNNLLSGSIPLSVLNFSRLKHLDLSQNLLTGAIPNSICGPSSAATLQFLSLANNNLTGRIPENLQGCQNLTFLYLGGNMLSGQIPDSLGRLSNLSTLDISFNNLSGSIPSLPKSLVTLTLKNNMLTGNLSQFSSNLPEPLQLLSLSTNRLEGEIPAGLGKLPNLVRLELNENQFSNSIPDTWRLSSPLNTLDFSVNRLSGVIPSSIYNLGVLTILKLQSNSLSGSISPSIEFMKDLTILNLAHNLLSGEIPPGIVNLRFVSILDLSWNQLTGIVPDEFTTLAWWITANVSTDNNPGLRKSSDASPAPTSGADDSESGAGKSWTLTIILVVDSIVALVDAYALYAYWRLPKLQKEEKVEPLYHPSLEYAVTVHELRKATNNFHEDNIVGRGARSIVYKGTVGSGQIAVKVLRIENEEKNRETLLRELETLGRVRHRNVLRILAVCSDLDTKALVLEYMPFSSLEFYLYKMVGKACLSWDTRFNILVGVAQGLVYLHREHQEPIVHCDLKPSNILLDSDFEPKVADFGIAKHVHPGSSGDASMSGLCGTIGYIPPEYAWASSASTKGDVFSFGIVLLETLTARRPCGSWVVGQGQPGSLVEFVAFSYPEKIISILDPNIVALELDGELHEHEVRLVLQIGLLCTQLDPKNRPDMRDVLNMLTDIKIQRFTSVEIHKYLNVDELAHLPSTWDTQDDPTNHILQMSEESKLEDWIARRIMR